jgi:hypothetical protein
MEMKMPGSGDASPGARCKKRAPSRLQKQAPASLQLEQAPGAGAGAEPATAWGGGRTPIPLLSPLVVSPTSAMPVCEADQQATAGARREGDAEAMSGGEQLLRGAACHVGSGEHQRHDAPAAGWRHPALSTPVADPASLAPLFQSQCAVEVRGAQQ